MCVCVTCECVCAQSLSPGTLCDPTDCIACQAPLSTGLCKARILEKVAISPSGIFWPRVHQASPESPALAGGFFITETPGKPTRNMGKMNSTGSPLSKGGPFSPGGVAPIYSAYACPLKLKNKRFWGWERDPWQCGREGKAFRVGWGIYTVALVTMFSFQIAFFPLHVPLVLLWTKPQWDLESLFPLLLLLLLSRFSSVRLGVTPLTEAHQAPPSLGFSRQEHRSGLPFPSPMHESEKWKGSLGRPK